VARVASSVVAAVVADEPPRSGHPLARYRARCRDNRRAANHRAASRTPVALLSARRPRCYRSARFLRSR